MTLFDTLHFNYKDKKIKHIYQDLANHIIAISQGVPFYHAGQEMYRSKDGVENSYKSPDAINMVKWYDYSSIKKFKQLLKLRKNYSVYRLKSYDLDKVSAKVHNDYVLYTLKSKTYTLDHYIKNDFNEINVPLNGKLIFSSKNVKHVDG